LGWVLRHLLETSRHDDAHADDFPMGSGYVVRWRAFRAGGILSDAIR